MTDAERTDHVARVLSRNASGNYYLSPIEGQALCDEVRRLQLWLGMTKELNPMTDKIRAAAEQLEAAGLGHMTSTERLAWYQGVLQKHFGADLERLGLLRTCDQCGLLYDRANGGACKCGVQAYGGARAKEAMEKCVEVLRTERDLYMENAKHCDAAGNTLGGSFDTVSASTCGHMIQAILDRSEVTAPGHSPPVA